MPKVEPTLFDAPSAARSQSILGDILADRKGNSKTLLRHRGSLASMSPPSEVAIQPFAPPFKSHSQALRVAFFRHLAGINSGRVLAELSCPPER